MRSEVWFAALLVVSGASGAWGQEHEAINEANNPLTPKVTINFHNYYVPELTELPDRYANQFLLRGLIPADVFGAPQLFRYTLPIATAPEFPSGYVTGLGDLTIMDIFVIPGEKVSFGFGPLVVFPTATDDSLGAGKWQAGAVGLAIAPQRWGLLGSLVTFQTSFAGQSEREDVSLLTVQPIVNFNLKDGYYLRSTAIWNFDLEGGDYSIPVGLGLGKVIQLNEKVTMNAFVEPQYTVSSHGAGQPEWQIFAGVNFQFAIGK
ncbi:hypothetical protein [Mesorhizobium sp. 1B3]|uniref:hypothetical protein n=1 Tax=Mesorhizobium sp. 1B3 TaxID=3243599 RepID=UPI003D95CCD0